MKKSKTKNNFLIILFAIFLILTNTFIFGCNSDNDNFFVSSDYIMAYATDHKITEENTETNDYTFDINYRTYLRLNSLHYECKLYLNYQLVETLEDEITFNEVKVLYSPIPIKTETEYDRIKVTCTGYSNENPKNFFILNAKPLEEMRNCEHKNLVNAKIWGINYSIENCYSIITFDTDSVYCTIEFFYDLYSSRFKNKKVNLCIDCGFFSIIE